MGGTNIESISLLNCTIIRMSFIRKYLAFEKLWFIFISKLWFIYISKFWFISISKLWFISICKQDIYICVSVSNDLFSFATELDDKYMVISVRAPQPMQPYGNAWYTINFILGRKYVFNSQIRSGNCHQRGNKKNVNHEHIRCWIFSEILFPS